MSLTAFDTLRASRLPRDAGVEERQADALVQVIQQTAHLPPIDHLATKADLGILAADLGSDLGVLRADLSILRADLENSIGLLRRDLENSVVTLRSEIESLRIETKADNRVLAAQMGAWKAELIWWVVGAGAVGVITQTGLKLLHLG